MSNLRAVLLYNLTNYNINDDIDINIIQQKLIRKWVPKKWVFMWKPIRQKSKAGNGKSYFKW